MVFRRVTEEEVADFKKKGWVYLPKLMDAAAAADVYRYFKGQEQEIPYSRTLFTNQKPFDFRLGDAVDGDGPTRCVLSEVIGESVARLLKLKRVRLYRDQWLVKQPHHPATVYHQDFPSSGLDRSNFGTMWISLTDQPRETGILQFLEGSHRYGVIGKNIDHAWDVFEKYPDLREYDISPQLDMNPGDATFHHALTIHGAPANTSGRARYGFVCLYGDADAIFTGQKPSLFDSLGTHEGSKALVPNTPIDHPRLPVIYSSDECRPARRSG